MLKYVIRYFIVIAMLVGRISVFVSHSFGSRLSLPASCKFSVLFLRHSVFNLPTLPPNPTQVNPSKRYPHSVLVKLNVTHHNYNILTVNGPTLRFSPTRGQSPIMYSRTKQFQTFNFTILDISLFQTFHSYPTRYLGAAQLLTSPILYLKWTSDTNK